MPYSLLEDLTVKSTAMKNGGTVLVHCSFQKPLLHSSVVVICIGVIFDFGGMLVSCFLFPFLALQDERISHW